MTLSVRPMRRTDLASLIPLHCEVFAGSMGVSLGERYVRAFFGWYIEERRSVALVAESDGALAGYIVGAPHGHGARLTRALLPTIVRAVLTHPGAWRHANFGLQLRGRLASLSPVSRRDANDSYGAETYDLVAVGTAVAFRGHGVATRMVEALERAAHDLGFARVILHVYSDNVAARTLYARRGYRVGTDGGRVITMEKACGLDS